MHVTARRSRNEISIHAPRVGSDETFDDGAPETDQFQSTLPAWGATERCACLARVVIISIHAPRVGSDRLLRSRLPRLRISIHAPRVGSDRVEDIRLAVNLRISIHAPRVGSDVGENPVYHVAVFQSTLPAWGATRGYFIYTSHSFISIHAPRVGSDVLAGRRCLRLRFQSTLPAWGATLTLMA